MQTKLDKKCCPHIVKMLNIQLFMLKYPAMIVVAINGRQYSTIEIKQPQPWRCDPVILTVTTEYMTIKLTSCGKVA